MNIKQQLEQKFRDLESSTVSDSFGGPGLEGAKKAPSFTFSPIMLWFAEQIEEIEEIDAELAVDLKIIKDKMSNESFKYTLECLGRFSFCIELTNLKVSSTKMKTRWIEGFITKTQPGTYANYKGTFSPGNDQRSASFDNCFLVMKQCISLLANSEVHINLISEFSDSKKRGTPYESVFTYVDYQLDPVHIKNNIRLVKVEDAKWLVAARPIIQSVLSTDANQNKTKVVEKIGTKSYKTDRSQTGEEQTNRAKRWECLSRDFQHATIEECWSVEKKLLHDVANFVGFPVERTQLLHEQGLLPEQDISICPVTFEPMVFSDLLGGGGHGQSKFQVGHMIPLKAGGKHQGQNIEWISENGNRIQGSLSIDDTRRMLRAIFIKMSNAGLI